MRNSSVPRQYNPPVLDRDPEKNATPPTLLEMSSIWNSNPQKFEGILGSLANDNDLPDDLALQLLLGAFYGMASESFSSLLHDAYPMPE